MNVKWITPAVTAMDKDGHVDLEANFRLYDFLIEKGMPADRLCQVLKEARDERKKGFQVLTVTMNKNKKFQKEQLAKEGYTEFKEFFNRD